jgi:hypothetical protein
MVKGHRLSVESLKFAGSKISKFDVIFYFILILLKTSFKGRPVARTFQKIMTILGCSLLFPSIVS